MAVGMGGAMLLFQVLASLLLVATASSSGKSVIGLRGSLIVLQAEPGTRVHSITWKHYNNKAVEWDTSLGNDEPTYFCIFKSVTTLDTLKGALEISNLQPYHSGKYSVEVNGYPTNFVTLNVLEKVFVLSGGSIVLQAEQVTGVSSIIWKFNKYIAAEWFKGNATPTYHNIFEYVTTLNKRTWSLKISNLQTHFSGNYSAQINKEDPTQFVTLTVLGPVSKPTITVDCNDINCTLTCKGREDGFTKYTWASGIHKWPGSELTVKRRHLDVVYTCNISNPVSWASRKHVPTPPEPVSKPTITVDCIGPYCTLTCKGKEDGFTTYTWVNGIHNWPGSKLTVERRDRDVVYTCNISNPVSWASSHGTVKPPPPGHGTAIALLLVFIVIGIIIFRLWQVLKKKGKNWTDLRTMTSQDRADIWRSFIPCNNGADEKPADNQTPMLESVKTEDERQAGANPDPSPEGKLTEKSVVSTADGEPTSQDART